MQTRIYKVTLKGGHNVRLVEAASAAQAVRHVVKDEFIAEVATTKEVAYAMNAGAKVESAQNENNKPGHQPTTEGV